MTADDDLLVAKLAVDLSKAGRVDLVYTNPAGTVRFAKIPVNRESGEVMLNVAIQEMRSAPAHIVVIKLASVGESGARILGEYTFDHTLSSR